MSVEYGFFPSRLPARAQEGKPLPHSVDFGVVCQPAQPVCRLRSLGADSSDAKAVSVQKFEDRDFLFQFSDEAPDAEVPLPLVGVVKKDKGPIRKLQTPGVEVMPHGLVGVVAVDVQE